MDYSGNLFVIAAPSGAGKSSLVNALLANDAHLQLSISHTTRPPRGQEQNGREYFFVSDAVFDAMVQAEAFMEWASVHHNRYGTSKQAIEERLSQGADIILEIDYQGALQTKKLFANAATIFILPPSWNELRARLERRGEDSSQVIETRLENAAHEMAQVHQFDFVTINASFDEALFDLQSIVHSQRLKYQAQRRTNTRIFEALRLL